MEKEHAAIETRLETADNIPLRVPLGTNIPLVAFLLAATTLAYKKNEHPHLGARFFYDIGIAYSAVSSSFVLKFSRSSTWKALM